MLEPIDTERGTGASSFERKIIGRPLERQSARPAQISLGGIIADLPVVRRTKKVNTMSRVHRRLIEPLESDQDNEVRLSLQHR
jgi:hypothetical protein